MKTVNLPYEVGEIVYVIEYCMNINGIPEIAEISGGPNGNKKKVMVLTCPYEKKCQHGPMHSDACNHHRKSFEQQVFPVKILQYVIDKDGVCAQSNWFCFKWSVDKLFETEKSATNYLIKNAKGVYKHEY